MSGTDPDKHQLLEIGAISCDPISFSRLDTFHSYVGPRPGQRLEDIFASGDPVALEKTGLIGSAQQLSFAAPPKEAVTKLLTWMPRPHILVGYNLTLDLSFLRKEGGQTCLSHRVVDLSSLCSFYFGQLESLSLESVCNHLNIPNEIRHRALEDAELAYNVFLKLIELIK